MNETASRRQWVVRAGLIGLWLMIGGLWGLQYGRKAIGVELIQMAPLIRMLGEESSLYSIAATVHLRAFLRLIVVLSVAGNVFWLVRLSRGTELAYQSFVVVLWIGLLASCPLPRMAEQMAQTARVTELVNTRSGYSILGDAFASVLRNDSAVFLLACAGAATCLARALVVLFGRADGGTHAT